jgi:HK97 family phage major capsid protein
MILTMKGSKMTALLTRKSPIPTGSLPVDSQMGKQNDDNDGQPTIFEELLEQSKKGHWYSVPRALHSALHFGAPTGLEGEVNQELQRRAEGRGRAPDDSWRVPWRFPVEQRSLTTGTGVGSITAQIQPPVDVLRSKMVSTRLGTQLLNLTGDGPGGTVQIPVRTGGSTAQWIVEGGSANPSNSVTAGLFMLPSTVSATAQITRKMLRDLGQPGFTDFTLEEMMTSCAVALDTAVVSGSGIHQPLGLASNPGITAVSPASDTGTGGVISYTVLEEMESVVGQQNGDSAAFCKPGWVTSPLGRSQLRKTDLSTVANLTGRYAWQAHQHVINGEVCTLETVLGWHALSTNAMPSGLSQGGGTANLTGIIFGNWGDVIINTWDSFAVMLNPMTQSVNGSYTASVFLDCASLLRRNASFASCFGWAAS